MKSRSIILSFLLTCVSCLTLPANLHAENNRNQEKPCIVNFINFIRQVEPRNDSKKDRYLYRTTRNELKQRKFKESYLLNRCIVVQVLVEAYRNG